MTEETTNENVMVQQPTTETEPAKEITMKTYYWSNEIGRASCRERV